MAILLISSPNTALLVTRGDTMEVLDETGIAFCQCEFRGVGQGGSLGGTDERERHGRDGDCRKHVKRLGLEYSLLSRVVMSCCEVDEMVGCLSMRVAKATLQPVYLPCSDSFGSSIK